MKYKNHIALFLFIIGLLILNYWTEDMLIEQVKLVRIVGQIGINVPLFFIFLNNRFYRLKEKKKSQEEMGND
jgi:hypothetical protein